MEKFEDIYHRAAERKGGEQLLSKLLSKPKTTEQLLQITDAQWLEEFTRKVFQCGFYWSVIDKKWPGFREVFWDFDIEKLLMMPPEMLEKKATDTRIVRSFTKVKSVPVNTLMIHDLAKEHGSFAKLVAHWPKDNITGLWAILKKQGSRLGGNTGAYALRAMGVDTFILSSDVANYLRATKIIDGGLHTKRSLAASEDFFAQMREQSGRSSTEISQIISYSCGDNHVGVKTTGE